MLSEQLGLTWACHTTDIRLTVQETKAIRRSCLATAASALLWTVSLLCHVLPYVYTYTCAHMLMQTHLCVHTPVSTWACEHMLKKAWHKHCALYFWSAHTPDIHVHINTHAHAPLYTNTQCKHTHPYGRGRDKHACRPKRRSRASAGVYQSNFLQRGRIWVLGCCWGTMLRKTHSRLLDYWLRNQTSFL